MKLAPRPLVLKLLSVKDKPVLAIDTGYDADSLEGMRLVKASRGTGWVYQKGELKSWTTRGVLQDDKRLVVWGDSTLAAGATPPAWPQEGDEGRGFLKAFVAAWTARAAAGELPPFSASAVVPYLTEGGWAFVFPPDELRAVLDSMQALSDRLSWEHYRHPDATGVASWAFTSAALGVFAVSGVLPWLQDDEAHLRQELRTLGRTLSEEELPPLQSGTATLWFDSLTGRGRDLVKRWQTWASENKPWDGARPDAAQALRREQVRNKRLGTRQRAAFWRRRGTVVIAAAAAGAVVLAIVGSVVWGLIKPDPTDTWLPEQVVNGYYSAMANLDSDQMRKLTSFDHGQQHDLVQDQDEATNVFVIRQVRTAYEQKSPLLDPAAWEAAGKPPLEVGKMLHGLVGVEAATEGNGWVVHYRKWVTDTEENQLPKAEGTSVTDHLTLIKTGRGWKISSLRRDSQPLP